jgi:uncharacterized protein (DUF342 family)
LAEEAKKRDKLVQERERTEIEKEVSAFNKVFSKVKTMFSKAGYSIKNEFRLADKDGNGKISLKEFI